MIALRQVNKRYDHGGVPVDALRNIDLSIQAGEFVAIMGPSGSGKSTLLNLLSALDRPTSGSVFLDGRDVAAMSDDEVTLFRRHRIGLIFQFFNLLPTLTAVENVLLPILMTRAATDRDRAHAVQLLQTVHLGHRLLHKPGEMSGGEMQRVAIARAFVTSPPIILADEPTGNLDSASGSEVLQLLRTQAEEHGATVVMVTHDAQAAGVGSRLLVIRDGQIQRDERTAARGQESGLSSAAAVVTAPHIASVSAHSGVVQ